MKLCDIVDVDDIKELIRRSFDLGIFGKKNEGKGLVMSTLGCLQHYYNGAIVFSNYKLNYPHVFLRSVDDIRLIYKYPKHIRKIALFDDFERSVLSRLSHSKLNITISDLLLDFGKINCSIYVDLKRSMALDLSIRESLNQFWFVSRRLSYKSCDPDVNEIMNKYLNFQNIYVCRYDEDLNELNSITFNNLHLLGCLYNTQEIISGLTPFKGGDGGNF